MARIIKGHLFQRNKGYYLQYNVGGKRIVVSLKDHLGNRVTDRKSAQIIADETLAPIRALGRVEQLRKVRDAIEDAESRAMRLEKEQAQFRKKSMEQSINESATIVDGWSLFMSCPKRPMSCRRYADSDIPKHSTAGTYKAYYRKFVAWIKSNHESVLLLASVTPSMALEFMKSIQATSASGTFNKYLQFFQCFYTTLIKSRKLIAKNPFADIERTEHTYHSKKELSRDEIALLIHNAEGEMKVLIALGYFTGLRLGDCCTLLWSEVDLDRRIIERIPNKTSHTVKDIEQSKVKLGIPKDLMNMLQVLSHDTKYVLPSTAESYLHRDDSVSHRITRLFSRCGIETHDTSRSGRAVVIRGFHSLRYSYISHNAEAGVPATLIQRNAGHSSPAMTEHYTKVSDATAVRIAEVLKL